MAPYSLAAAPAPQSAFGLDLATQEKLVQKKLADFTWDNPLGVSPCLHYAVMVYAPALVVSGLLMNFFSGWVLESTFLKDLVVQPLLLTLLQLNSLVLFSGPLYVWLVQSCSFYIRADQIFHCFLLNVLHNFSLLSSTFIIVLIVLERGLVIGRPKETWTQWRNACTGTGTFLLQLSMVLSLGELYSLDSDSVKLDKKYPVCVPWWENEHGSAIWYKVLASIHSLGPALVITACILVLEICSARFTMLRRMEQDSLNDYQALLMELSATVHFKFVNSASALGIFFIVMCSPIGLFILVVPALQGRAAGVGAYSNSLPHNQPDAITNNNLSNFHPGGTDNGFYGNESLTSLLTTRPPVTTSSQPATNRLLGLLEYRYALVSRTDTETLMWFMRYTFCGMVVPILLVTEVLFAREWKGRIRQIMNVLCFWRASRSIVLVQPGSGDSKEKQASDGQRKPKKEQQTLELEMAKQGQPVVAGPYIARVIGDEGGARPTKGRGKGKKRAGPTRGIKSDKSVKDKIQVFDASKPARAGRKVDKLVTPKKTTPDNKYQHRDGNEDGGGVGRYNYRPGHDPPNAGHAHQSGQTQNTGAVPDPGVWSTVQLPVHLTSGGQASIVAGPGWDILARNLTLDTTAPAGRPGTSSADTHLSRPAQLLTSKKSAGIPGAATQGQAWDYQLLAQLAAIDTRRRNFMAAHASDAPASGTSPGLLSRSLPGLSMADNMLNARSRSRSPPQQQRQQQQQQPQEQSLPPRPRNLKPLSTGNTPRVPRANREAQRE
ncbi:hypothetical protein ElyMa_004027100 [Elysia marginata]|uniref:G-protein coupled receptors family 1 profile domain-containing protein n=1 Tax=Elysia marginata TaxID=1093978 RepID=A0AAV4G271_9GAST|nr:hypothetical protein ElyMa_004027100 [Elysia marginata]